MARADRSPHNILVVEDDFSTREMLRVILEAEGLKVAGAGNGREALNYLYRMGQPDLILLDLMMPVMSGWEFRYEQRHDPDLAAIPVVVCSAAGDLPQEVSLLGAAGCLQKPIDVGKLLDTVQAFCV